MQIARCVYENIGPFEKVEVDFSVPGLTVIEGCVLNDPFASDNGAGKSYLLSGIGWCLYGQALEKDRQGDAVIRTGQPWGSALVNIRDGKNQIRVKRYRKHPKYEHRLTLHVNKEDRTAGTSEQTQKEIINLLGMDWPAAANRLFFGSREDVKSFYGAPEAQRKEVLDSLMELEIYAKAEIQAKKFRNEVQNSTNKNEADFLRFQQVVRIRAEAVTVLEREITQDASTQSLQDAQERLKKLETRRRQAAAELLSISGKYESLKLEHADKLTKYETDYEAYHKLQVAWASKSESLKRSITQVEERLRRAQADLKGIISSKSAKCGKCRQVVSKAHSQNVAKEISNDIARYGRDADALQMELEIGERNWEMEEKKKPQLPASTTALDLMEGKVEQIKSGQGDIDEQITQLKSTIQGFSSQQERLQERLKKSRQDAAAAEKQSKAAEEQRVVFQSQLEDWNLVVEAMGNAGVKSFLMEAELPEINRYAAEYASRLLGAGVQMALSATTLLKSGAVREKLLATASLDNRAQTHGVASASQKRKMDLSLMLAFRRLREERSSKKFEQFFADELFDNLDRVGIARVIGLLKEIAKECPVILVTHEDSLRQIGDRRIRVTQDAGVSTVKVIGAN